MSEENNESNIIEKKDLGNGKKQVTFKVDASDLNKYTSLLNENGISYENEVNSHSVAKGSVRSRYAPSGSDYLSELFNSNSKPYTNSLRTPISPHQKMQLAIELYYKEPIIGTVIDMMVDFSASGFVNECEDNEIKKLYDEWATQINLENIIEQIFLEYYRSGNVSIYRNNKDLTITKTKKSKGKVIAKQNYNFTSGYTVLNPLHVVIEGPLLFNQELAYLTLGEELFNYNSYITPEITNMMPTDISNALQEGKGRILLDPELLTRITRKKQPYERYAIPFLERVFEAVIYKQKLRMMDASTIEGTINQLVTVTVGNDTYPASDEDLEAIAQLFQTPNKAYTVFWNHTLEVKFHKPEGLETLTEDKYKQVNDDILAGLGVSRVLIDGQGANFSTAWVSILSLIERLDNTRRKVTNWLESEYRRIALENGFTNVPRVRFDKMNLREDNYVRDVLIALYDRGLLDAEDLLRETGRDYLTILETKKRNEANDKYFLPPEQPFQGGNTGPNNGKPTGPNQNSYKDRESNPEQNAGNPPKSKAEIKKAYSSSLEEDYEDELIEYYNSIKPNVAKVIEDNKNNKRKRDILLLASIIGLFNTIGYIGSKYINDAYDEELSSYPSKMDKNSIARDKKNLKDSNDGYIHKLANDIKDDIIQNLTENTPIDEAVEKAFNSNAYRIRAMAESVVSGSQRVAKIKANESSGKKNATWRTHIDDKTCSICRGLDGRTFPITDIPVRPHLHCRCDLDFE